MEHKVTVGLADRVSNRADLTAASENSLALLQQEQNQTPCYGFQGGEGIFCSVCDLFRLPLPEARGQTAFVC